MRDRHRLKEKYEVILDGKQVRNLLLGALLALGAVFGGGIMLGKSLARDRAVEVAADPLAALDERTQKLEEVRADAAYTFQDELTRQRPATAPLANEAPARVVVVQPAPGEAGSNGSNNGGTNGTGEGTRTASAEPRPEPARPTPPPPAPARVLNDKPAEEATPTRMNSGENALKDALARATQHRIPETSASGNFTLQLAASQSRSEADRFASNLREKGYAPYIVEAQVDGKGTFYRVRMGRFSSKDAAQKYLQDFRRETQLDAFIAPAN